MLSKLELVCATGAVKVDVFKFAFAAVGGLTAAADGISMVSSRMSLVELLIRLEAKVVSAALAAMCCWVVLRLFIFLLSFALI